MEMKTFLFILFVSLYSTLMPSPSSAGTPRVTGPDVEIIDNNIIVKTSIADTADLEQTIRSGAGKEIIFTAELIRVWRFWPDEFVVSKKIRKIIKYDNLREQYRTSFRDGITRTDKKYSDFTALKDWIFTADAINLANIRELEPGDYYIRVVVESKSREQLPLIGLLMHLIPEVEMSLAKESRHFAVGTGK
jgi:hypothetical protein